MRCSIPHTRPSSGYHEYRRRHDENHDRAARIDEQQRGHAKKLRLPAPLHQTTTVHISPGVLLNTRKTSQRHDTTTSHTSRPPVTHLPRECVHIALLCSTLLTAISSSRLFIRALIGVSRYWYMFNVLIRPLLTLRTRARLLSRP